MAKVTPTQRSLKLLRDDGWTAGIVERFNPHVGEHGIRQDFCGGIDVICFSNGFGITGIQCCAASGLAAHRKKLLAEPRMREWIAAGGRLVLHAWRKTNDRSPGSRKLWRVNEVELRSEDFEQAAREPREVIA